MRVTHVITRLIVGGAQENTVSSVLGLQGRIGLTADLISGPTEGPEGSLEAAFTSCPGALRICRHLIRSVHPFHDSLALRDLTGMLRRLRPQIVHTHSSKAGILGRLAAHRAGVPIIVHTIHGPSFGNFQGSLRNAAFTAAERYAARYTTHFVSVADAMTRQFLDAGIGRPHQFTRIWSGFDLEPFLNARNDPALRARLGFRPDDFVLGKIARLFELKGHDDLIASAPALIDRCPQIKFLLVGGGPWQTRLQNKVRAMNLNPYFVFTGLVPPSEIASYVGIMDTVIHLSHREGLSRALPQALAAGRPLVAYDCDGAGEACLNNETGFLIPPRPGAHLIDAVVRLAQNRDLREQFGRCGQGMVRQRFPAERMVDDLHKLYLKLSRQSPPACP